MSEKLIAPDLRRILDDVNRRLGILERRITNAGRQAAAPAAGHTHDGDGADSIILSGDTQSNLPAAPGELAVAIGNSAYASGAGDVAIGSYSSAQGAFGNVSIGDGATAGNGIRNVAVGAGASATYDETTAIGSRASAGGTAATAIGEESSAHNNSVAVGHLVATTASNQVNLGTRQLIFGGPNVAPSNGNLIASQIAFSIDEGSNTLRVKVKYSTGTVKTGTVSLT